jgi:hypothetical protein
VHRCVFAPREYTSLQRAELETMKWLNSENLQGENRVYDFGNLGLLHISWRNGRWDTRWLKVLEVPKSIRDVVEEEKGD